jgi:hypothetical protein
MNTLKKLLGTIGKETRKYFFVKASVVTVHEVECDLPQRQSLEPSFLKHLKKLNLL